MSFDPRAPYEISLDCFADVPEAERPAFKFRRINGYEFDAICEALDSIENDSVERQRAEFKQTLLGWRNQYDAATGEEIAFDSQQLQRVANPGEVRQILQKVIQHAFLNGAERKNSGSPS